MTLEIALFSEVAPLLSARFSVGEGEMVALVGPSGSGKTTILRAVAGLWRPERGRVAVGDDVWLDTDRAVFLPPHRRAVGMVFQSYALFPHMSAAQNVMAAMGALPAAERAARAEALLSTVNLDGFAARLPAQLSGGQQQRVAVARALARAPRALLLDEPFSAVDRATRERLYREIAELRRRLTMPVVLVTHDMDEAARLADRIVVLREGRSLQSGAPIEVTTRPVSPAVARLVGVRNVFSARVVGRVEDGDERGGAVLDWRGLRLETRAQAEIGARVAWAIPDGFVVLHRRDRPSRGERENPVPGVVSEMLALGQTAQITLRPDHAPHPPLNFSVPLHVAQRNALAVGVAAAVSLLADGVHVMPDRADWRGPDAED